jgi:hypothetical protein
MIGTCDQAGGVSDSPATGEATVEVIVAIKSAAQMRIARKSRKEFVFGIILGNGRQLSG